ncbi:inactive transglutaminase family protein [Sulfurimonas sp. HSL-3221]|uniref:UUP1 family membrane protein n=1 Tax=Sulfurimonadaceae TaxID=2771471 RepID=UPI001E5EDAE6|nr:UUP1 family membrane protein [Sulfurimonas sp. HSL-3221]UFS63686.1 inactive transglutaminase family protein [Sulfurimonas sp. HSL-3221]
MISSRFQVLMIAMLLAMAGLFVSWYKVVYLGVPVTPHDKRSVFTVTAEVDLEGTGSAASVSLRLPSQQPGMKILEREGEAGEFGMTTASMQDGELLHWTKRQFDDKSKLFYKVRVTPEPLYEPQERKDMWDTTPAYDDTQFWDASEQAAAAGILNFAREHSADGISLAAQLIDMFNTEMPTDAVKELLAKKNETTASLVMALLAREKVPFRKVRGIMLEDGQKKRRAVTLLEVKGTDETGYFSFKSGQITLPENFFVWSLGNRAMMTTKGIAKARLRFSVSEAKVAASMLSKREMLRQGNDFLNFSLYTLPSSQQNAFKQLLLIPIGALVVVIFRILIGIRTMGTFMPVLFALAFIQTTLLSGLAMFFVIVASGLIVRSYLSRLQLLLVARISAVIIVVISIMSIMSIISFKLGIDEVLKITFFPMIILSWTIERMSILWEESGAREALTQVGGSLIVAIAASFAMDNDFVRHLTFTFPELQLLVLAMVILIGRYTGYRLSELVRFAPMAGR